MITWDILITTIPHRQWALEPLLAELDRQMRPGVGVRVYRDNLQAQYGDKCRALIESSAADYISFLDDDDWIAPDYLARVMLMLLAQEPDYVGFTVKWTRDDILQKPVEHSLRYRTWENHEDKLLRDFVQFNPIRRNLALMGEWSGGYAADERWATSMRACAGELTEAWLGDEPAYYYQESTADTFNTGRQPWAGDPNPLPDYPWLVSI